MQAKAPQFQGEIHQNGERLHNGLKLARVADIQRARLIAALAEAANEHGAANVTVTHVVLCAGVSRRTFYELFSDIDDCLLAAIDDSLSTVSVRVIAEYRSRDSWRERVRAGLAALLLFLEEEPYSGRLLVVESLAAGRAALERRSQVVAQLVATIDEGAAEKGVRTIGVGRLTAEGVVGAVLSVIHERMSTGQSNCLIDLLNPLMSMIVLPYLGAAAARRELGRSAGGAVRRPSVTTANPLRDLRMRLTYRTACVLSAVAGQPRCSNRMVADASGIRDQGQVSKLLARLEKLGLIENAGASSGRGEPNAWTLTKRGKEVHRAIAAQGTGA